MTSLRWLKLNRTGLCYLPEELAALQKLVRGSGQAGRVPVDGAGQAGRSCAEPRRHRGGRWPQQNWWRGSEYPIPGGVREESGSVREGSCRNGLACVAEGPWMGQRCGGRWGLRGCPTALLSPSPRPRPGAPVGESQQPDHAPRGAVQPAVAAGECRPRLQTSGRGLRAGPAPLCTRTLGERACSNAVCRVSVREALKTPRSHPV